VATLVTSCPRTFLFVVHTVAVVVVVVVVVVVGKRTVDTTQLWTSPAPGQRAASTGGRKIDSPLRPGLPSTSGEQ